MPAPSEKPLARICVRIWQDDYLRLRQVSAAAGDVGLNLLIRTIIHSYITQLDALERRNLDALDPGPITITTEATPEAAAE